MALKAYREYTKAQRSSMDTMSFFWKPMEHYEKPSKVIHNLTRDEKTDNWFKDEWSADDTIREYLCCSVCHRKRGSHGHKLKIESEDNVYVNNHKWITNSGSHCREVRLCKDCRAYDQHRWSMRMVLDEITNAIYGYTIEVETNSPIYHNKNEFYYNMADRADHPKWFKGDGKQSMMWGENFTLNTPKTYKELKEFEAIARGVDCRDDRYRRNRCWGRSLTYRVKTFNPLSKRPDYEKYKKCAEILDRICWTTNTPLGVAMFNYRLKKDGLDEIYNE